MYNKHIVPIDARWWGVYLVLEKQIDTLRRELQNMIEDSNSLCNDSVIQCSQKLDKLIDRYYNGQYDKTQKKSTLE